MRPGSAAGIRRPAQAHLSVLCVFRHRFLTWTCRFTARPDARARRPRGKNSRQSFPLGIQFQISECLAAELRAIRRKADRNDHVAGAFGPCSLSRLVRRLRPILAARTLTRLPSVPNGSSRSLALITPVARSTAISGSCLAAARPDIAAIRKLGLRRRSHHDRHRHTCTKHTCTKHTCTKHTCTKHTCTKHTCTKHTCTKHTCTKHTCTKHT
jgi:hypothetical protein